MEKLKELLNKAPILNVVAAAFCLVSGPFHLGEGRDLYAMAVILVGAANAWLVYRRVTK